MLTAQGMHLLRLVPAIQRHARIALFLSAVKEDMITLEAHGLGDIAFLGLYFLQTHDIGLLALHPIEKTLGCRGPDAVQVLGNDAHVV